MEAAAGTQEHEPQAADAPRWRWPNKYKTRRHGKKKTDNVLTRLVSRFVVRTDKKRIKDNSTFCTLQVGVGDLDAFGITGQSVTPCVLSNFPNHV